MKRLSLLFGLVIVLGIILVACGDVETSADGNGEDPKSEQNDEVEETTDNRYELGDTAEVGGIKLTIKNVEITDERNEFADEEPEMVVKIEYELENDSDEEIPVGADFQVYDGTGNQVDLYPLDNTMGSLKPGKKMQGVEHYGIEEGPIELYFQPMFSLDEEAIFELEIE